MDVKSYPDLYINNLIYLLQNIPNINEELIFTDDNSIEKIIPLWKQRKFKPILEKRKFETRKLYLIKGFYFDDLVDALHFDFGIKGYNIVFHVYVGLNMCYSSCKKHNYPFKILFITDDKYKLINIYETIKDSYDKDLLFNIFDPEDTIVYGLNYYTEKIKKYKSYLPQKINKFQQNKQEIIHLGPIIEKKEDKFFSSKETEIYDQKELQNEINELYKKTKTLIDLVLVAYNARSGFLISGKGTSVLMNDLEIMKKYPIFTNEILSKLYLYQTKRKFKDDYMFTSIIVNENMYKSKEFNKYIKSSNIGKENQKLLGMILGYYCPGDLGGKYGIEFKYKFHVLWVSLCHQYKEEYKIMAQNQLNKVNYILNNILRFQGKAQVHIYEREINKGQRKITTIYRE